MLGRMAKNRYVVIMAGGKGERFWPQSRLSRPKHLLPIVGNKPMLAQTVERLGSLVPPERVLIITNREQRDAVCEVCSQIPADNVIAEPVGRDTAAAVGLAALLVKQFDPEATFAILPADHVIHDASGFQKVLAAAFAAAEKGDHLITIGIAPQSPATGYGYIQRGDVAFEVGGRPVYGVKRFVEKPDLETAQGYLQDGGYFWNAGMFVWQTRVIRQAIVDLAPKLETGLVAIETMLAKGLPLDEALAAVYPDIEKISVDYAIMEKASGVLTMESAFDWDDVGEWPSVARHQEADASGNVLRGEVLVHAGSGNIAVGESGHLLTLVGVDDLIVVHTKDATLVCPKDKAQEIKEAVKAVSNKDAWKQYL